MQIAPDGSRTDGTFYIQKPGKVRFEYNPPSPIEVIADGSSVVVRNRDLLTQDLWPLSQTPLRYLLADHINLLRDTDVVSVSSDDKFITVVIEEKQVMVGTSRLMVMFDAKDFGAQAMDRHRSARAGHDGFGLQSRRGEKARSEPVRHQLPAQSEYQQSIVQVSVDQASGTTVLMAFHCFNPYLFPIPDC